jgi:hypothetical protein
MNVDKDSNGVLTFLEMRESIKEYDPPIELSSDEK